MATMGIVKAEGFVVLTGRNGRASYRAWTVVELDLPTYMTMANDV